MFELVDDQKIEDVLKNEIAGLNKLIQQKDHLLFSKNREIEFISGKMNDLKNEMLALRKAHSQAISKVVELQNK